PAPVPLNMGVGDWRTAAGELDGWFKPNPGMGGAVTQNTVGGLTWYAETPLPGTRLECGYVAATPGAALPWYPGAPGPGTRFEYGYVPAPPPAPAPGPGGYVTVSGVTVILHD